MGQVYGPILYGPNREGKIILIFLCKDKIKYYPTLEEQYKDSGVDTIRGKVS
jgi:hypothetical protein